jgi:hypothetical protein
VIDAFCIHNSRGIRILPPEFWKAYDFLARKWSGRWPVKNAMYNCLANCRLQADPALPRSSPPCAVWQLAGRTGG